MSAAFDVRPIPRIEVPFAAELTLPGSKSIALRHLLMSSLADSPTHLDGIPRCDDIDVMFEALQRLGMGVERHGKSARLTPPTAPVKSDVDLDLGMSGVSLRLLLAHAALRTSTTRFTGHRQLHQRPNADLLEALATIGCRIESNEGRLPIGVTGPACPIARTTLATDVTSQYLSGLMLFRPGVASRSGHRLEGRAHECLVYRRHDDGDGQTGRSRSNPPTSTPWSCRRERTRAGTS